jgi:hypothetical protein
MGPYAKIIVTPNHFLKIDQQTSIKTYCDIMWDGIYISDPLSQIEVTGNSLIKDAINGLVSENGGIITTNDATLKDNYYSIRVKNTHNYYPIPGVPYTPYPCSIKNTRSKGIPIYFICLILIKNHWQVSIATMQIILPWR